jgi:hypothetical protein
MVRAPACAATKMVIRALRCAAGDAARKRVGRLSLAAATIVLCATAVPVDVAPCTQIGETDPRVQRLGTFFQAYHCPEPHHVDDYLRAADRYGLDYRLLPAISLRETTCGRTQKDNNLWGYHPGRMSFASVESGIEFLSRRLAKNPPYAGKTLREKLRTYNPRPAYLAEVERIMKQIE